MAEFVYNNTKNANPDHTSFKLNYDYHPHISYKEDINPCSKSQLANELSTELWKLMTVYKQNLYYAQKLQKQAHNKTVKARSYVSSNKVWLNSIYIQTNHHFKLETKFFEPFWVLYLVGNQASKLKLPKKWKIYDVFYVLLLEHDTIKKEWVDEIPFQLEFKANKKGKEYEVKGIWDSAVYVRKSVRSHLPELYYLVLWKKHLGAYISYITSSKADQHLP